MGINADDIEKVREGADIVGVVSQFVALRKTGNNWMGLCPFHGEKSPSFSVSAEKGFYYCFGCQKSGDVIAFVEEMEGLDFPGAMEWLATKQGVQLRYDESGADSAKRSRRKRLHDLVGRAGEFYHQRLLTGSDAGKARAYLRSRGYDRATVEQFQLGYSPDGWDVLAKYLKAPTADLDAAGLGYLNRRQRQQDFFRGRVMFPIFDVNNNPVGFGGRQLPEGEPPKYKNSAQSDVYDKSRLLYALNWAKKDAVAKNEIIVCEGYTDVIGYFQAGLPRAVATCGTSLTEDHVRLMKKFASRVVLSFDADGAGRAAADKFYEWERQYQVEVRVAALPDGADPGELAQMPDGPALLQAAIANAVPFLAYRIDRVLALESLDTPEGRARAAEAAIAVVAEHPNELLRDQYVMEVASRTRTEPHRLRQMLQRLPVGRPAPRPEPRASAPRAETRSPARQELRDEAGDADRYDAGDDVGAYGANEPPGYYDDDPELGSPSPGHRGGRQDSYVGPSSDRERYRISQIDPRERELIRLLIHRPADIAQRAQRYLFTSETTGRAYELVSTPGWEHRLGDEPDVVANLLRRLTMETVDAESNPIEDLGWVVRDAALRMRAELEADAGNDFAAHRELQPLKQWLNDRFDELQRVDVRLGAIDALLGWLNSIAADHDGG
jgi:DNA primase